MEIPEKRKLKKFPTDKSLGEVIPNSPFGGGYAVRKRKNTATKSRSLLQVQIMGVFFGIFFDFTLILRALLSVEVDILFSPLPSGPEYENRVPQRPQHHKALLNLPASLAQVSRAQRPRQKLRRRCPMQKERWL